METIRKFINYTAQKLGKYLLATIIKERNLDSEKWIDKHATGTLRKNKGIGFSWKTSYLYQRVAWEFGYWFKCRPKTRITFGDAITEDDCPACTEAGWLMERYLARNPIPDDYFEVKYIIVSPTQEEAGEEGIGLVLRETTAQWIPQGHLVYCIVAPFNTQLKKYEEVKII